MSGRRILFVHSPLVGPSSLRPMADAAAAAGFAVSVPDLTATVAEEFDPHAAYTGAVVTEANRTASPIIVVGHSGAGAFLPTIGQEIATDTSLIFVDAVLPPQTGAHRTPARMTSMLDDQTEDGVLREWLSWWPDEVVADLLPSAQDRRRLRADMPRVRRSFYDADITVPAGWSDLSCAYLRLSEAYDDAFIEARARGWPAARCESTHLGVYTDASRVFTQVAELAEQLP